MIRITKPFWYWLWSRQKRLKWHKGRVATQVYLRLIAGEMNAYVIAYMKGQK